MKMADVIRDRAALLSPERQLEVLDFVEFLHRRDYLNRAKKGARKRKEPSARVRIKGPVAAIAGMWADRTDLPKDTVDAVRHLRIMAAARSCGR